MTTDYKDTLNLPITDFQMKAQLAKREPEMMKAWIDDDLYGKIRKKGASMEKFTLHDGPPYANGHIHMGHALNKILKDIILKSKFMNGFSTDYVPGWDCHGLPIELQVEKNLGKAKDEVSKVEIRKKCRAYAKEFVDIQKDEFKRLGIMGLWDEPYLTMNYSFEAAILGELKNIVEKDLLYKGKKPIHWCASCETALAEAEVEHADKTSPAVFVKFKVKDGKGIVEEDTYFVIWTTTPWTLPANMAIAIHHDLKYVIVETPKGKLVVNEDLVESLMETFEFTSDDFKILKSFIGAELDKSILCTHPWIDRDVPVLLGDHVTNEAGTGCVHIAPGHGQDDYELGLREGLEIYAPVSNRGLFTSDVPEFEGQFIFKANKSIIELLKEKDSLVHEEELRHSYPHCWRCKKPVIFRATEQWFITMEGKVEDGATLRERALKAIDEEVKWIPAWGKERIHNMIEARPDWCLSRQRAWGVPIPAVNCGKCGHTELSPKVIENLIAETEKESSDVWFEKDVSEFLPNGFKCSKCGASGVENFNKEENILDVWFDSGVSFAAVLEKRDNLKDKADLYLEGSDQHRGWFHSSLLTSIATRGRAPYESVLTHGFVVDGKGKKMSKSTGNVVAPEKVIEKYGAEVLRLWVSAEDYRDDIRISEEILKRLSESYRRIRNTFRFILGNLNDFDPAVNKVDYGDLTEIDRLTLHRLNNVTKKVLKAYDDYEFHSIYQTIQNFCTVDLSAFYLDILKDRLYTAKTDSQERRAGQTVMYEVLTSLLKLLSPVLTFTTDEAWRFLKGTDAESVHLSEFPKANDKWEDNDLESKWAEILTVKEAVSKALEEARQVKTIGHSLDALVKVYSEKDCAILKSIESYLKDILIVSQVTVTGSKEDDMSATELKEGLFIKVLKAEGEKCERCWNYSVDVGVNKDHPTICGKCSQVLK